MANLATWIRPKDKKWFRPFFAKDPDAHVFDARTGDVPMDQMDGLLLTGGSDIAPEFLRQEIVDPTFCETTGSSRRFQSRSRAVCRSSAFAEASRF